MGGFRDLFTLVLRWWSARPAIVIVDGTVALEDHAKFSATLDDAAKFTVTLADE